MEYVMANLIFVKSGGEGRLIGKTQITQIITR